VTLCDGAEMLGIPKMVEIHHFPHITHLPHLTHFPHLTHLYISIVRISIVHIFPIPRITTSKEEKRRADVRSAEVLIGVPPQPFLIACSVLSLKDRSNAGVRFVCIVYLTPAPAFYR
jgi:hypothetical protein